MPETRTDEKKSAGRVSLSFFCSYFLYYCGYCILATYIVPYLTDLGYSASYCGLFISLALVTNIVMQTAGGYITDTFLCSKHFLVLSILCAVLLLAANTAVYQNDIAFLLVRTLTAGICYSIAQWMDAWSEQSRALYPGLRYSKIRAGGSVGYGLASIAFGYYFQRFGFRTYFWTQAAFFLAMLPLLSVLPKIALGNSGRKMDSARPDDREKPLSFGQSFEIVLKKRSYLLLLLVTTLYWAGHRPVGSYLSLIIQARGGDAALFGMICGTGALCEFVALMWVGNTKRPLSPRRLFAVAVGLSLLRPLILLCSDSRPALYAAQLIQSVCFSFYYASSVRCYAEAAEPRIRSFSISTGLTLSCVIGSVIANSVSGALCDRFDTDAAIWMSMLVSGFNAVLFFALRRQMWPDTVPAE